MNREVVDIRIQDIKDGLGRARKSLMEGNYILVDTWLLSMASNIKSLEHAVSAPPPTKEE